MIRTVTKQVQIAPRELEHRIVHKVFDILAAKVLKKRQFIL